jgi:hypothetical protein
MSTSMSTGTARGGWTVALISGLPVASRENRTEGIFSEVFVAS